MHGNLICPAEFDIGDLLKLVLYSVPEGDDKPLKYPLMFSQADAVVLTKVDLLPHFEFSTKKVKESISRLNKKFEFFEFSKKDEASVRPIAGYLESNFRRLVRSFEDL
jgi:hydrogenase nickel incorporation protein HypB